MLPLSVFLKKKNVFCLRRRIKAKKQKTPRTYPEMVRSLTKKNGVPFVGVACIRHQVAGMRQPAIPPAVDRTRGALSGDSTDIWREK